MNTKFLQEIGVKDFENIHSYKLVTKTEQDTLSIRYNEKRFKFFPKTQKINFHRRDRAFIVNNDTVKYKEISPILINVLNELDKITPNRKIFLG